MSTVDPALARARAVTLDALDELREHLPSLGPATSTTQVGHVVSIADGIATATAMRHAFAGELVDVAGVLAVAEDLREDLVRLVLLGAGHGVESGSPARRLGQHVEVPTGIELLGRVIDPLGRPLDGHGPLSTRRRVRVDGLLTPLAEREPVSRPLRTGVFAVDTMIPIGRGQRQLIIGDRSTGKTELCLDILAGLDRDTVGIYVAIGRRGSDASAHVQWLHDAGVLKHGIAVITDADDPVGLLHLAPYSAATMAEQLAEQGRDVVVVYDDLTAHAHAHRTLALLMGRPVGREAHPADIFYAHARLLERAGQLGTARGGGSVTAFPVVETQGGDLTGYIPTNLVSITDGQIRLDAGLAAADIVPAVDVALSVSRVGGKAQPPLMRSLSGSFKNRYAQFLELETFARFGTRLEASAQAVVDWGRRVRRALRQSRGRSHGWPDTAARLLLVQAEGFERLPMAEIDELLERGCSQVRQHSSFALVSPAADALDEAARRRLRQTGDQIVADMLERARPSEPSAEPSAESSPEPSPEPWPSGRDDAA